MLLAAIGVGTAAQWMTFAGVAGLAWALFRGGGGAALSTLEAANRVLTQRVDALERQATHDTKTIAALRARTDVALALQPLVGEMQTHEVNAQARADRTLNVLDLIARRLGPDESRHE